MNIPHNAEVILHLLNQNGFKAYVVGGCVRDNLLGKGGGDIDITTSALPYETEKILAENVGGDP